MDQKRKHYLHSQYVLSLINDGDWYRECKHHFDDDALISVPSDSISFIRAIANDQGDDLSFGDRAFIYLQLATYYGVSQVDMRDAMNGDSKLRTAMTALIRDDVLTPTPTETTQPTQQEVVPVTQSAPAFQTKHYVYGQDVTTLSSAQLIEAIKRIENEIADLKVVKVKSTKIAAEIASLNSMLTEVVAALDAK
jgi:hypothetical protein